jgi:hypothetical protein
MRIPSRRLNLCEALDSQKALAVVYTSEPARLSTNVQRSLVPVLLEELVEG